MNRRFLSAGIDVSSTSITFVAYDYTGNSIAAIHTLSMDEAARAVGVATEDGVVRGMDGSAVLPPAVLVHALDAILRRAAADPSFDPGAVAAASVSCQGHLTAYMKKGIIRALKKAVSTVPLAGQVAGCFTGDCPTWRDASTAIQTRVLNERMKAHGYRVITMAERYPGPQIAKRVGTPVYEDADWIVCGNALMALLLTGTRTFSGPGDAAASGFVDVDRLVLHRDAMGVIAPGLESRVAEVTPPGTRIGGALPWVRALGFSRMAVYTSDQDNIKSGAYLIFAPGIVQVSLGTSYTASVLSRSAIPGFEGNFASNDADFPHMLLLCKNNGSASLSRVLEMHGCRRDEYGRISDALRRTPPGNGGAMALPWFVPEIVPYVPDPPGILRRGYAGRPACEADLRAFVEGSAASMKIWADEWFPRAAGPLSGISFAGGAAHNADILRVWVDMFGVPGYCPREAGHAAAIGAALTAAADYLASRGRGAGSLRSVVARFMDKNPPDVLHPQPEVAAMYASVYRPAYAGFEAGRAGVR